MISQPAAKKNSATAMGLMIIIWLAATMAIGSCGKKGPPEPPGANRPPQVLDLGYSLSENVLKLTWTIPAPTATAKFPVDGFAIFRFQQSAHERECPNCPMIFQQVGEVPARRAGAGQPELAPLVFTQTIKPGYRYTYKMKTYDDGGTPSKDSNLVQFTF